MISKEDLKQFNDVLSYSMVYRECGRIINFDKYAIGMNCISHGAICIGTVRRTGKPVVVGFRRSCGERLLRASAGNTVVYSSVEKMSPEEFAWAYINLLDLLTKQIRLAFLFDLETETL